MHVHVRLLQPLAESTFLHPPSATNTASGQASPLLLSCTSASATAYRLPPRRRRVDGSRPGRGGPAALGLPGAASPGNGSIEPNLSVPTFEKTSLLLGLLSWLVNAGDVCLVAFLFGSSLPFTYTFLP